MQFKGREKAHPELGAKILDQIIELVEGYAKVESQARFEGGNMSMVLVPDRKAMEATDRAVAAAAAEREAEAAAAAVAATEPATTVEPTTEPTTPASDSGEPA